MGLRAFRKLRRAYCHHKLSDKGYAERRFLRTFGRPLNLESPTTFNEKIQWLKLYDRRPLMTILADKLRVRDYVRKKIGARYLIPLLGVYDSVDALTHGLASLPNRFVVKATHGSGWVLFVSPDSPLEGARQTEMREWLSTDYYALGREWCYKGITPRLICESFIEPVTPRWGVVDYKLFCCNGEVRLIQVDVGRFSQHRRNLYDLSWTQLPVTLLYPPIQGTVMRPVELDKMIDIAQTLAKDVVFARVDLYCEERIQFGEMTLFPGNGFEPFEPPDYDVELGRFLALPIK